MIWTLDIETIASTKPTGVFKKQLISSIKSMRNGTGFEKDFIIKSLPDLQFPLTDEEISHICNCDIRMETILAVENKANELNNNNALDKRYNQFICYSLFNGIIHRTNIDKDESSLLKSLMDDLKDTNCCDVVGWNTERFDIPVLEFACYRNKLPNHAHWFGQTLLKQHTDLFWMFNDRYSKINERWNYSNPGHWVSLDDACEIMGISILRKQTGGDIAQMYKENNFDGIVNKCALDTTKLHLLSEVFSIE